MRFEKQSIMAKANRRVPLVVALMVLSLMIGYQFITGMDDYFSCPPAITFPPVTREERSTSASSSSSIQERYDDASLVAAASSLVTAPPATHVDSNHYWESRYAEGGNSGFGSYGELSQYKAHIINALVQHYDIQNVAEFGCGDGNNLKLYDKIPQYDGYDVSNTVIQARREEWKDSTTRQFVHFDGTLQGVPQHHQYDMTMSLDVLYHLMDSQVFTAYLDVLFFSTTHHVLIYANDEDKPVAKHMLYRRFTPYIAVRFPCWRAVKFYPHSNILDVPTTFFHYVKRPHCVQA